MIQNNDPFLRIVKPLTVLIVVMVVFFALQQWLPPFVAMRFIVVSPFILILPGYFLTAAFYPTIDQIERATSSITFSIIANSVALLIVEQTVEKLTPLNTGLTIVFVNVFSEMVWFAKKNSLKAPKRLLEGSETVDE